MTGGWAHTFTRFGQFWLLIRVCAWDELTYKENYDNRKALWNNTMCIAYFEFNETAYDALLFYNHGVFFICIHYTKTYIPATWESIAYADGNVLKPAN